MKIKIISDLPQYDLSNSEVMAVFNGKLNGNLDGWSFDPLTKILNIEASEETIKILIEEYKEVIEILPDIV